MVLDIFLNIVSSLDELHYYNSRRLLMNNLQKIVNIFYNIFIKRNIFSNIFIKRIAKLFIFRSRREQLDIGMNNVLIQESARRRF